MQLLKDSNLLPTDQIPQLDMFVVNSEADAPGLQKIRQNPEVLYVEKNNVFCVIWFLLIMKKLASMIIGSNMLKPNKNWHFVE